MSARLGDQFPQTQKEEWCNQKLRRGSIWKLNVLFFDYTSQKNFDAVKRIVLWGVHNETGNAGYSVINSLNRNRTDLLLSLKQCKSFLDHDSYLACHNIYEIPYQNILDICISNTSVYLGLMGNDLITEATKIILGAPTITNKHRKRYGFILHPS